MSINHITVNCLEDDQRQKAFINESDWNDGLHKIQTQPRFESETSSISSKQPVLAGKII